MGSFLDAASEGQRAGEEARRAYLDARQVLENFVQRAAPEFEAVGREAAQALEEAGVPYNCYTAPAWLLPPLPVLSVTGHWGTLEPVYKGGWTSGDFVAVKVSLYSSCNPYDFINSQGRVSKFALIPTNFAQNDNSDVLWNGKYGLLLSESDGWVVQIDQETRLPLHDAVANRIREVAAAGMTDNPSSSSRHPISTSSDTRSSAPLIGTELVALDADLGGTKAEVIQSLARLVAKSGRAFPTRLVRDVIEREGKAATGLPGGLAFPHARSAAVTESALAFARLSRPVDFGAKDGPADLVFLIAVPEGGEEADYLKMLTKLARALVGKEFLRSLRAASSKDEIVALVGAVLS